MHQRVGQCIGIFRKVEAGGIEAVERIVAGRGLTRHAEGIEAPDLALGGTGAGGDAGVLALGVDADHRAIEQQQGAPQGLSYGQRQSEQMVNKGLSVAAKYIKFRGFVRLDELEVTGSPLVMFHPRSS